VIGSCSAIFGEKEGRERRERERERRGGGRGRAARSQLRIASLFFLAPSKFLFIMHEGKIIDLALREKREKREEGEVEIFAKLCQTILRWPTSTS